MGVSGVSPIIRSSKTFRMPGNPVYQILQTEIQRLIRIAEVENVELSAGMDCRRRGVIILSEALPCEGLIREIKPPAHL